MKKYYTYVNGQLIEVSKEVKDVLDAVNGDMRRERYILEDLSRKHEVSYDYLEECEFPIESHLVHKRISLEDEILQKHQYKSLYITIKSLTPLERKIIILLFFYEKTEREIAQLLGCSQPYVYKTKRKAMNKIKSLLLRMFL